MKKALEETPSIALTELRDIQLRCEAVASCRVLPLAHDMKIQAIARAAKRAMPEEASDQLYALEAREKAIVAEIVTELQKQDLSEEVMQQEYVKLVGRNAEIREIRQVAEQIWRQKVPFQIQRLAIPTDALTLDEAGKFEMPETAAVNFRGQAYKVDPYTALLDLAADEIIILE